MKNKPLIPIFLIVFIDLLGFGIIIPLLPSYAESFGASDALIGVLLASYSVMQFVGAPLLGRMSDRWGRKPILLVSQVGTLAGFILLALAHSLPLLFISRMLDGFTGGNLPIAQAAIADVTDEKDRAKAYGLIGAAFGLGFILGPALGGILSRWGYSAPAIAATIMSALTIVLTVTLFPETHTANSKVSARREVSLAALRQALANRQLLALLGLGLMFNFAFAIFQTTFSLFSKAQFGFNVEQTGYVLAYVGVLIVIAQLVVLPRLLKPLGERRVVLVGVAALGVGLFLVGLVSAWPPLLGALVFTAIGGAAVNPALQSLYTRSVSADERGGVLGLATSADSLARIGAPLWGGWVLGALGAHAPAFSAALLLLAALIYAAILFRTSLWRSDRPEQPAAGELSGNAGA